MKLKDFDRIGKAAKRLEATAEIMEDPNFKDGFILLKHTGVRTYRAEMEDGTVWDWETETHGKETRLIEYHQTKRIP